MNDIYSNKSDKAERWADKPKKQYEEAPEEEQIRLSIKLPKSWHEEIIHILPSLYGKKRGKNGKPLKPTITDYISEAVAADLERRRNQNP